MTTTTTMVGTTSGRLRGMLEDGVVVFRGIPYARPPVGPLRFAPPQPPEPWAGERDATAFGPPAMQAANAVSAGQSVGAAPSEDCLTLNVWTLGVDGARRPVLVWLHGGAFVFGAGSQPMHDGALLARRGDLVVVTLNYRLGLFGYLRGVDVCGEALPSTGQEGLLDQLAALAWVQREIGAFGGDPARVTVAGQSAGARSIAVLLALPRARGLFHRAILQSGAVVELPSPASAATVARAILADVGLTPREAARLRDLPAAHLLAAQGRATPRAAGIAYGPVADGVAVPAAPLAAIAAGSAAGIPLLIGTNLEEAKFHRRLDPEVDQLTDAGLLARLRDARRDAQAGDGARFAPEEAVGVYRRARAARGESTAAPELWFAMLSDRRYRVPAMRLAEAHAAHTPQTYAYLFTWRSPAWGGQLGAGHGVEIPFVFGTLDAPDARDLIPAGAAVGTLPERLQDAWVAFARTGSPATPQLPGWAPYDAHRRCTVLLGRRAAWWRRPTRRSAASGRPTRRAAPPHDTVPSAAQLTAPGGRGRGA
ncbi:MAG TPA: carboxylesterase family protein [Thermomicrobiales bacterium]|nr:carboxylesterase family protein [Thermomicrobiales bacterium]